MRLRNGSSFLRSFAGCASEKSSSREKRNFRPPKRLPTFASSCINDLSDDSVGTGIFLNPTSSYAGQELQAPAPPVIPDLFRDRHSSSCLTVTLDLRINSASEWNVQSRTPAFGKSFCTRSRISAAAFAVNVSARIFSGSTPDIIRYWIRLVKTEVFPEPAPAKIKSCPFFS